MHRTVPHRPLRIALLWCAVALLLVPSARGQVTSRVFLQDSQRAQEALPRVRELASSELYDEAARVLHELLISDAYLLLPLDAPQIEDVLIPVRQHVHNELLGRPALLERYRALYAPLARARLDAGESTAVERELLLTPAGFDAALAIARDHLEHARFLTAWRTLDALDQHPDRTARAREAAEALALVWRFLDGLGRTGDLDPESAQTLTRWLEDAGLPPGFPDAIETPTIEAVRTLFEPGGSASLEGIMEQPLASRSMGPTPRVLVGATTQAGGRDALPQDALLLHVAPTLAGDRVYTNTSDTVSAWNRYTGEQLWSATIDAPARNVVSGGRSRYITPELSTVCVADDAVVALMGAPELGVAPDRLVVGFDPETGDERWRVAISDLTDVGLEGAVFAGPPAIVEGTIVVRAIESDVRRRTIVHHLVALDAREGTLRWARPITSVGSRPYDSGAYPNEGLSVLGPDIIHVSSLGAVLRIEAATGRTRWVRREDLTRDGSRLTNEPAPWRVHKPCVTPARIYTLAPDRRHVLVLDAPTGALLGRSPSSRWDQPLELHLIGEVLVGVSDRQIVVCPADQIDRVRTHSVTLPIVARNLLPIRGRSSVAGSRLYMPLEDRLAWVDIPREGWALEEDRPELEIGGIPLDHPGNALILDGQILATDDTRLHIYFAWETAQRLLTAQQNAEPNDPVAPTTYALLAYRAGEPDEILPALDRALRALASDPLHADFESQRRSLFDAVLLMARPDRAASSRTRPSDTLRRALLERLEQLAATAQERVDALESAGSYFEAINDHAHAVDRYQRLLSDPALHAIPARSGSVRARAADEAARRLATIVSATGRSVYEPYDEIARREAAALGPDAPPASLLALARAFPIALITPDLYLRAGEMLLDRAEHRSAVEAYEAGLRSILPGERSAIAPELAGRAVVENARLGRLASARQRIREFRVLSPDRTMTYRERPLDAQALLEQINTLEAERQRRPRLGATLSRTPRTLPALRAIRPVLRDSNAAPSDLVLMRRPALDEIQLWGLDNEGRLVMRWGGLVGHDPLIVRDNLVLTTSYEPALGRIVHCFDVRSGEARWRSDPFLSLFAARAEARSPLERELLFACSDRTLLMVERSGRMAAIDLESGRLLWRRQLGVERVIDIDLDSGSIAIVGLRMRSIDELRAEQEPSPIDERFLLVDERTGVSMQTISVDRPVHWVRFTPDAAVLVGTRLAVVRFDGATGRREVVYEIPELEETTAVAVADGRSYVLSSSGLLYALDTTPGSKAHEIVNTGGRIGLGRSDTFTSWPDGDLVYLASSTGVIALDQDHKMISADTRSVVDRALAPALSERFAISVSFLTRPSDEINSLLYPVEVRSLETGRLVADPLLLPLRYPPDTIIALEGHLLVSAGMSTLVIEAPPEHALKDRQRTTFDLESVYEQGVDTDGTDLETTP